MDRRLEKQIGKWMANGKLRAAWNALDNRADLMEDYSMALTFASICVGLTGERYSGDPTGEIAARGLQVLESFAQQGQEDPKWLYLRDCLENLARGKGEGSSFVTLEEALSRANDGTTPISFRERVRRMWKVFEEDNRTRNHLYGSGAKNAAKAAVDVLNQAFLKYLPVLGYRMQDMVAPFVIQLTPLQMPPLIWPMAYVRSLFPRSLSSRWQVSVGLPRLERLHLDDGYPIELKDVSASLEKRPDGFLHLLISRAGLPRMDETSMKHLARDLMYAAAGELTACSIRNMTLCDDVPREGRFPLTELDRALMARGVRVTDSVEGWMEAQTESYGNPLGQEPVGTARDDTWGQTHCPDVISLFLQGAYDEEHNPWRTVPFTTGFFAFPAAPRTDIQTLGSRMLAGLQELDPDTAWHMGFGVGRQYCYEDVFVWDLDAMLKAAKTWCRQEGLSGVWFQEHRKGSGKIPLTDETS